MWIGVPSEAKNPINIILLANPATIMTFPRKAECVNRSWQGRGRSHFFEGFMLSLILKCKSEKTIITFLPFILLMAVGTVAAQSDFTPIFHPELHIPRAAGEIKIDGLLNDAGWQGAAVADHFHETEPGDNIKPPVETKVLVTYNESYLYLSAICYDNPSEIRSTLSQRDNMNGDNIGFFIDTYGDAAWAYTINVNPFGVQADALWSNGYGEDGMFDLVFESAGKITDSGYQVELAIPFSSLRFPSATKQVWRMQFWRHHYRDTHYAITWTAIDRNESNWVRDWGTLTGLENVAPGKGIEIIPAWTGSKSGALDIRADSSLNFDDGDIYGELALSGKYAISSNITIDATINPDFSNVESDEFQIDVNSPTALSYSEKRPFFQEGSDLFRTRMSLVYTRSINEPDFAAKLTARLGRTSISFLSAHDLNSPFIIPFEETSSGLLMGGKSFSNILRIRRTFGSGSQAGLLITDRRWEDGGGGTTYSADATISFTRGLTLRTLVTGSYTDEPNDTLMTEGVNLDYVIVDSTLNEDGVTYTYIDSAFMAPYAEKYTVGYDGESFGGYAVGSNLGFTCRNFHICGSYDETGPTFRADNGWITRNGRRSLSLHSYYQFRFNSGLIERISIDVNPMRVWNTDGYKKDEAVFTTLNMPLRFYQTSITYQNLVSTEKFAGIYFGNIWNNYFEFSTSPGELASFGGSFNYGNQIAYGYRAMGRQTKWEGWLELNLFDRLQIETWATHVKSRNLADDLELFNGYLFGNRISFQYDRRLSIRLLSQYDDFGKTWNFDPLITYKITPFSLFYAGSTYYVQKYDNLNEGGNRLADASSAKYSFNKLESRQFFMKLQYLFQI